MTDRAASDAVAATARGIDTLATEPILVFGSVPPRGRDLDLLVRNQADRITGALSNQGFVRHGRHFVRFEGCSAVDVEVVPASAWSLPEAEVAVLFERARPLEGFSRLVRPSPEHALLIVARRLVRGDGRLDDRRRGRLERILDEDPDAWERAASRAAAWGGERALRCLRSAYLDERPVPLQARAAALSEDRRRRFGTSPIAALVAGWRAALPTRPHRAAVIALSGLDGSGKSSQAHALRETLERLGYPAVVEWHRFANIPALNLIAEPVKRLLTPFVPSGRSRQASPQLPAHPASTFRKQSRPLNYVWVLVFAVATGLSHRRSVMPHLRRGRIVICDRYVLDSVVHLRRRYGDGKRFSLQRRLIRLLAPRPMCAYLLDVPPSVAYTRKPERFTLEQLERLAAQYLEEHRWLGVRRLNGDAPVHEICAAIGRDVWLGLRSERPKWRSYIR